MYRAVALAFVLGAAGAAANAAEQHRCVCKANGQNYEQGQIACVLNKLQRCSMLLNNSSWKVVADVCPLSSLAPGLAKNAALPETLPRSALSRC